MVGEMFCQPKVSSVWGQSALFGHSYLGKHFEAGGSPGRDACALDNFAILLILRLLGVVSFYTAGGFVPLLLVVAVGVLLIRVIEGRRP